jgi:hypothetical protein
MVADPSEKRDPFDYRPKSLIAGQPFKVRKTNLERGAAPFRRLNPFEAFCGMFWGTIDLSPRATGGMLGTSRPAPFAFWFIAISVIFIFGILFLDGWEKVHSGVPYDDAPGSGSYSTAGGH